ncbi:MAG: acyl-ACP--UDP-N-acetylglucosamine O-acyltransferase [Chlamydia sp.]
MTTIHSTAIVEKGARIGNGVVIGPYSVIGPSVVIGDNVVIKSHVVIDGHTTIGEKTTIWPGAVIGTKTQDLKFRGETTFVSIGKECEIREYVTINSSCGEGTSVQIGNFCLIMAYCHIAHNCMVGDRVVMSNNATLAGHVIIEDCAVIGGLSAVHQFSRIGRYSMVGGMSRVTHDIPPYTIGAGAPYSFGGINRVGLSRHGYSSSTIHILMSAFRILYRSHLPMKEALEKIRSDIEQTDEVRHLLVFCQATKRGIISDAAGRSKSEDLVY